MWVTLDKGDDLVPSQVGHSLALDYPAIGHFTLDELEAGVEPETKHLADEAAPEPEEAVSEDVPPLTTVVDVLNFARAKIAALTGMPADAIKLDLKMGV
jgi:hypothetical protein